MVTVSVACGEVGPGRLGDHTGAEGVLTVKSRSPATALPAFFSRISDGHPNQNHRFRFLICQISPCMNLILVKPNEWLSFGDDVNVGSIRNDVGFTFHWFRFYMLVVNNSNNIL